MNKIDTLIQQKQKEWGDLPYNLHLEKQQDWIASTIREVAGMVSCGTLRASVELDNEEKTNNEGT